MTEHTAGHLPSGPGAHTTQIEPTQRPGGSNILKGSDSITDKIREHFDVLDAGREQAYVLSRQVVRVSSQSIKSAHRRQFEDARSQLQEAADLTAQMLAALEDCLELRYGGFVADAQKEYAEAAITLAGITDGELPSPEGLGVDYPAWLNGLAEAAGEFRRHCLDSIREDNIERAETVLGLMDDIYHLVMGFDYPNAISMGLRGRSDACRGFVERTRGDVTNALRQRRLEEKITTLEDLMGSRE